MVLILGRQEFNIIITVIAAFLGHVYLALSLPLDIFVQASLKLQ